MILKQAWLPPCAYQVTFANLESTPKALSFAHAAAPNMVWEALGSMALRSHGDSRLQHVIKLGAHTQVRRYLRITFTGHLHTPSGEHWAITDEKGKH
jgi:hypothetical protein